MSTTFIIIAIVVLAIILIINRGARRMTPGVEQIDAPAAKEMAGDPAVAVLDVRTPQEFEGGHLKRARNLPLAEIEERIGELASLKSSRILVYCLAGGRSAAACGILQRNGFSQLANLRGGIRSWTAAGLGVER